MKVHLRDMRELGYCNRGAREFFQRHNLDWIEFVNSGIDADKLVATGDGMAIKVVRHAEAKSLSAQPD